MRNNHDNIDEHINYLNTLTKLQVERIRKKNIAGNPNYYKPDIIPTKTIVKHEWFSPDPFWKGESCKHCKATYESDLGGGNTYGECVPRIINDNHFGLTDDEFSYLIEFRGYKYDKKTGRFNKVYSGESFTLLQMKRMFREK